METIEIKNTSFLSKLNNYYYDDNDKPKSTCELNKRLITIFALTILSFPTQIALAVWKYIKPKEFSSENISYISLCFKIQIIFTIIGFLGIPSYTKKTNLSEVFFSDLFFVWVITPIVGVLFVILFVYFARLIATTLLFFKTKLSRKNKEKKESVVKKLYLSFKEKHCSTINWVD